MKNIHVFYFYHLCLSLLLDDAKYRSARQRWFGFVRDVATCGNPRGLVQYGRVMWLCDQLMMINWLCRFNIVLHGLYLIQHAGLEPTIKSLNFIGRHLDWFIGIVATKSTLNINHVIFILHEFFFFVSFENLTALTAVKFECEQCMHLKLTSKNHTKLPIIKTYNDDPHVSCHTIKIKYLCSDISNKFW